MKRYSEYKDTHRAWLGKMPKHWNIKCLKHASRFINGYAFSSDSYTDNGIPLVRIGDIKPKIDLSETKNVPTEYYETLSNFRIKHADILLALTGATIGKSSVYELTKPALLNQRVAIVRPEEILGQ